MTGQAGPFLKGSLVRSLVSSLVPLVRWCRAIERGGAFVAVAVMGFVVQVSATGALVAYGGWPVSAAAATGVLLAIVHNFAWHERWTWNDRRREGSALARLARVAGSTGVISLIGSASVTTVGVSMFGLPIVAASLLAVCLAGLVNYHVLDRLVYGGKTSRSFFSTPLVLLVALPVQAHASGVELTPPTVAAWDEYVTQTEARRAREGPDGARFLTLDFERDAAAVRRALVRGELVIRQGPAAGQRRELEVPGGAIHHWRAAVLVPHARADRLVAALRDPHDHGYRPPDVLEWRLLGRQGDRERVFLRIQRREIVTATYDTHHEVEFTRHASGRISSRSVATRIAELADAGTPREREKPAGRDRGFLWRLNSYWRYEEVPEGVIVELESLSLSRSVPWLLAPVAQPIVRRVARESIERTLLAIRSQLGRVIQSRHSASGRALVVAETPCTPISNV